MVDWITSLSEHREALSDLAAQAKSQAPNFSADELPATLRERISHHLLQVTELADRMHDDDDVDEHFLTAAEKLEDEFSRLLELGTIE